MLTPAGVLTSGDSGAAVFTRRDQAFLGTYVGASIFEGSGRAYVHYIQDAASLEQNVLKKWNVSIT
jgi:hypothetical protein